MANIKSQIKRIRTNEVAHERNKAAKSAIRTAIKAVKVAVEAKDLEAAITEKTKSKIPKIKISFLKIKK